MIAPVFRFLRVDPVRAVAAVASEPFEAWTTFKERYVERLEAPVPPDLYLPDASWERHLHDLLGVPWPCPAAFEFRRLWPDVLSELKAKRVKVGPASFKGWNDGDPGLVRAIWCLTRHLQPNKVVETGVAHGVTSRFILEALELNSIGHLWSIDRPPLERVWHNEIGMAVDGRFPGRWSYIRGSSARRLPKLLSALNQIDLFIHDSMHSEHNVRFETDRAWAVLRPGGAMVIDDIDINWGFRSFTRAFPGHRAIICEAEPIRPDLRRFNQKGLFGVILKEPKVVLIHK
jgi:hypothetical protein